MDLADQFLDKVGHLPPAPTIATQLLNLFSEPDRDLDRIVTLISHDPSLTGEVLQRCNSASFCGAEPVSDMFEAVTRLGFYEVYCVVTALVAARALSLAPKGSGLDIGKLWEHSVTTAVAASVVAGQAGESEAVAFTAGLLHDVGKLILASVEPVAYGKILQQAGTWGSGLVEAEMGAFQVSHALVGAKLLARWGLPTNVLLPVLRHHDSTLQLETFSQLWATVRLANSLAHGLKDGATGALEPSTENFNAMCVLHLGPDQLPSVLAKVADGLKHVQVLLQMAA
jgi:putative nucleotidyltransferase with HDIG domain